MDKIKDAEAASLKGLQLQMMSLREEILFSDPFRVRKPRQQSQTHTQSAPASRIVSLPVEEGA